MQNVLEQSQRCKGVGRPSNIMEQVGDRLRELRRLRDPSWDSLGRWGRHRRPMQRRYHHRMLAEAIQGQEVVVRRHSRPRVESINRRQVDVQPVDAGGLHRPPIDQTHACVTTLVQLTKSPNTKSQKRASVALEVLSRISGHAVLTSPVAVQLKSPPTTVVPSQSCGTAARNRTIKSRFCAAVACGSTPPWLHNLLPNEVEACSNPWPDDDCNTPDARSAAEVCAD